jgi:hypothetical protein
MIIRGMFTDMAVHQPSAGVVRLEGDNDEPIGRQQHDVTPGRVVQGQVELVRRVCLVGLLEDGKVVAVEMDLRVAAECQRTRLA